jgi:hypothetical protein
MLTEAISPLVRVNVPGFIVGRFWVTAEGLPENTSHASRKLVLYHPFAGVVSGTGMLRDWCPEAQTRNENNPKDLRFPGGWKLGAARPDHL